MNTIEWTQELVLGIPEMDDAHHAFVERLAALAKAPAARFCDDFQSLVAELERDFKAEEDAMEAIDFPLLSAHREQHGRALAGLHHVMPQVLGGDVRTGRETVELLSQWFAFHLTTMDAALAYAITSGQAPEARPAESLLRQATASARARRAG